MTEKPSNTTDAGGKFADVMKRVGAVSSHFDLESIRFVDCHFSYVKRRDGADSEVRLGLAEQEVELEGNALHVSMLFEFLAPPPFDDELEKQVTIRARVSLEYTAKTDRGEVQREDAETFGRVNGIYNAWPYLREYVQSSLLRLGLPPFELPLLRAGGAAQLAGFVDAPEDATDAESESH